jgi:predicted ATPase/class 3 adenylate cyclase
MQTCPSCGTANPEGFRLCGMCGAALTSPAAATRAERKVVSVLFCDLAGFTARSEWLDPEDVRALLAPYHTQVRAELERYGGTVEKFIGDAVMALFGAPTAHEDDPERAVRAALAIRDHAIEADLELRIGVTTGEALVSLDARPVEGEGMASGDVVNTAARLQSAAPVNGILVDETTQRATRAAITYRDAAAVEAKGKAEPVPAWEAVEARSRFGVDVDHHARVELVGREREVAALRDALERAIADEASQLVTIVGVPGIGKSRLLFELGRVVDEMPQLITWRQGRCLAYGDGVAYWALGEMVKAQAGIQERDPEGEAATKLRSAIDDVVEDPTDRPWIETHLRPLVGLEAATGMGGDRRGEAFAAWRRYLESLAERGPLVLVFEDLHWADDGLLDFVDGLVEWLTDVPLLVVGTARPELLERRPGWGGGKLNATTIGLTPLSEDQTAKLIGQVLQRSVLPLEVQQALLERAGGNPFYAEQFTELFLERGSAHDLPMPETIQGIIAARLDGLSLEEKALLQDASVLGKVFWSGALGEDDIRIERELHALARKGFLARQRRSSLEGEGEWAFAHMLLRDVAYGQIPRAERSRKHQRAAAWIQGLGRPEDHAELLAHHWSTALELALAAGSPTADLEAPTRRALRSAGERAFAVNAFAAAATHYAAALVLWPNDDPDRPELLYRYADALYGAADDRALAALEEARDALLAAGDRQTAAEAELSLSRIWWHRGKRTEGATHEARATDLVGDSRSPAAARVLATIGRTRSIAGELEEGLRKATEALAMAEELELDELRAHALTTMALAKSYLGDTAASRDLEEAMEIAIAANSALAGTIANNRAVLAFFDLDLRRSNELFSEGLRIAERFGDGAGVRWIHCQLATSSGALGRWDEAIAALDAFIGECEAGSPHYLESDARTWRAWLRLGRGDLDGALEDTRLAVAGARDVGDPQELLPQLGSAALLLEELGILEEGQVFAREVVELSGDHPNDAVWSLPFYFLLSRFSAEFEPQLRATLEAGPPWPWKDLAFATLDGDFVRAAEMWATAGSPTWEARLRMRAAEGLIAAGRRHDGEVELAKALSFYRQVGATYWIERGEALLARSA